MYAVISLYELADIQLSTKRRESLEPAMMRQTWTGDKQRPVSFAYSDIAALSTGFSNATHRNFSQRVSASAHMFALRFEFSHYTNTLILVSNLYFRIIGKFIFSLNFEYVFIFSLSEQKSSMFLSGFAACHLIQVWSVTLVNQLEC